MRNVTLSAEESLIDNARDVARSRQTTLNQAFREWLIAYTSHAEVARRYDETMARLRAGGPRTNRTFTRDEMHER